MSNENDVIVFDEEYKYASKEIRAYCDALIKMIRQYSKCVNHILNEAIKDEKISSGLRGIEEQLKDLIGDIRATCVEATSACSDYIIEIDDADNFLY